MRERIQKGPSPSFPLSPFQIASRAIPARRRIGFRGEALPMPEETGAGVGVGAGVEEPFAAEVEAVLGGAAEPLWVAAEALSFSLGMTFGAKYSVKVRVPVKPKGLASSRIRVNSVSSTAE